MVEKTIKRLVEDLDADTRLALDARSIDASGRTLVLYGQLEKSPFLRAVKRKAEGFGIDVALNNIPKDGFRHRVVADKETAGRLRNFARWEDVDNLQNDGMSSVAEAITLLLYCSGMVDGKNITIVGRGHSAKGLAGFLMENNATVTVAHRHTKSLLEATKGRDIVIYAAQTIDKPIAYDTTDLVVDLGGCVEHPEWLPCEYVRGIGPLTVSVLLNRFVSGG